MVQKLFFFMIFIGIIIGEQGISLAQKVTISGSALLRQYTQKETARRMQAAKALNPSNEALADFMQQETKKRTQAARAIDPQQRDLSDQAQSLLQSQEAPPIYDPKLLLQEARAKRKTEVKKQQTEQEKIIEKRFQRFTQIRNTPLPTKGLRANYTQFNRQFRPIARR